MSRVGDFVAHFGDQKLQKYLYPMITRRLGGDVLLMNYGYEEDPPMGIPLTDQDEPNRYPIQLYHRTATQTSLAGKRVLEVGCGHGGGASYLTRTLAPASYVGLDLNQAAVDFCRQHHHGLDFVQGDAQNLSFPSESFDAVVNVESSLHYPRFHDFLTEVTRILKPGGHFLYTDLRHYYDIQPWETALAAAPLHIVSQREINTEVMRGMELYSRHWQSVIASHVPTLLRPLVANRSGVQGSAFYRRLKDGRSSYRMYHMTKTT